MAHRATAARRGVKGFSSRTQGSDFFGSHVSAQSPAAAVHTLPLPMGDETPLPREDVAHKSLSRQGLTDKADAAFAESKLKCGGTVEELLQEQLVVIERTLSFNHVLAERLFGQRAQRHLGNTFHESTPSTSQEAKGPAPDLAQPLLARMINEAKGFASDLATPLLQDSNNRMQAQGEAFSPRSSSVASWSSGEYHQHVRNHDESGHRSFLFQDHEQRHGSSARVMQEDQLRLADMPARSALSTPRCMAVRQAQFTPTRLEIQRGQFTPRGVNMQDSSIVPVGDDQNGGKAVDKRGHGLGKSQRILHLFPSLEEIQELVMKSLGERHTKLENLYHDKGFWEQLAKRQWFNNLSLCMICLNAVWIAIDTDYNKADILCQAPLIFQVVENLFCLFFVVEMIVRIISFKCKWDALLDGALVFDCCLVASMVWETWILVIWFLAFGAIQHSGGSISLLRIFRLFRLTRVARTARLVGSVPELMILAKGMMVAVRSVAAVLCLLGIVIYVFSIIFVVLLSKELDIHEESTKHRFTSVPRAMNTLLLQVVCGFDLDLVNDIFAASFICYIIYLVYFLVASLTLMNMLVGILCDVVSNVAGDEKEGSFVEEVESLVGKLMQDLDTDGSHTLSKEEFDGIIMNQDMMHVLHEFGVDVVGIVDFGSFLFQECDELSFADFLNLVIQFRETKQATIKDVMDLRKYLARELSCLETNLEARLRAKPQGSA